MGQQTLQGPPYVEGVAGLVGVRSDRYYYVGKLDREAHTPLAAEEGYVALKDAYEIVIQHRPRAGEDLEMTVVPLPIGPFEKPTKVVVRVDAYLDLSQCRSMVEIDRVMTGSTGLLLPGMGPRR